MINLKYIVTGTGRCGTLFMANLLTSMGFPCSHEAIFTTRGLEFAENALRGGEKIISSKISKGDNLSDFEIEIVAESSYMAAPFLAHTKAEIIHVVRNPINVIASLIGDGFRTFRETEPQHFDDIPSHFEYEQFIYDNIPELSEEMSQIERACVFYIRWNQMIENSGKVKIFHRIEDSVDKLKQAFNYEGDTYQNTKCNSLRELSRKWTLQEIGRQDIKRQLIDMMKKYNYYSKL